MERISKMWRSALAMVLAICLVIGFCPVAAFAAPSKEDVKAEVNHHLSILNGFLEELPSAPEQAYELWVKNDYQSLIKDYAEQVIEIVAGRSDYYTEEVLPALAEIAAPLVAEKDPLVAELVVLKAELEVKKAELEKVLAENKIPSISAPDLSIDAELGNNEQTKVPESDCENSATELEAAIADLEHAIAVIEALISDIYADVEDVIAVVNEIVETVTSLQKTLADVAAAAVALQNAVDAVAEVLTNDTANSTAAAFVDTYNAARKAALVAADALNELIVLANKESDTVNAALAVLEECAAELAAKLYADKYEILALLPAGSVEYVVKAIGFTLWLKDATPEMLAAKKVELEAKLDELKAEHAPEIAAKKAELEAKLAEIAAEVEAELAVKAPIWEAQAKEEIAKLEAAAAAKLVELEAELAAKKAELEALPENAADAVRAAIQVQIDRVTGDIATVKADLECAIGHVENALNEAIAALVKKIEDLHAQAVAQLQKAYDDAVAAFEAAVADVKAKIAAIDAAINNAIANTIAKINAAIEAVKNAGIQTVKDLVDAIVTLVKDILHQATHADLVLDANSTYVALGDSTAVADGYVELVAAELKAQYGIKGHTNYAAAGNTAGTELANIGSYEELAGAELITIGFSNITLLTNALNNVLADEPVAYDWAELVGAELVPYVEAGLAKGYAEIAALGLDEESSAMLGAIVEGIAYGAAEYIIKLPQLIAAIRAVNEDAVIEIVGQYNPMNGVVLNLGETTVDCSEYLNYFVAGVSAYCFTYAVVTGEAIFVEAPAVDTINADNEWTIADITKMAVAGFDSLNPNAAGDAYIAEQILAALNISLANVGLWGDSDGNGTVNVRDAILALQAANGKDVEIDRAAADVTGDGKVTVADAIWILKRANGHADLFPVEK